MAILIDDPVWSAHGRLWSHLISDISFAELHEFANDHGLPPRGFDRDHYDVPREYHEHLVLAGARPVSSKEIVLALHAAGLRRRKRRPDSSDARQRS